MRLGRTLPPAAAPISILDIYNGCVGIIRKSNEKMRFEEEVRSYFHVRNCFFVSTGKAALVVILQALHNINPHRNEVIIPSFTCYSIPSAIVRAGLKVRVCDINPKTLDYDYEQLQDILEKHNSCGECYQSQKKEINKGNILAVIAVHIFGISADINRLSRITNNEVFLIEDVAQAMGNQVQGKKLGTFGDVGFFSLGRGKTLSTVEGGIIITDDIQIAKKIASIYKNLGQYTFCDILRLIGYSCVLSIFMHPLLFWIPKSLPFLHLGETKFHKRFSIYKMSSFQAGLSRNWIKKLEGLMQTRKENTSAITSIIKHRILPGSDCGSTLRDTYVGDEKLCLSDKKYVTTKCKGLHTNVFEHACIPWKQSYVKKSSLLRYPIILKDVFNVEILLMESERYGLGIARSYPNSLESLKEIIDIRADGPMKQGNLLADRLVTLPVHSYMTERDFRKLEKLFCV